MIGWSPGGALEIFGVTLIGVTEENLYRLLVTVLFLLGVLLVGRLLKGAIRWGGARFLGRRTAFWARQAVNIATATFLILGFLSIWFEDPARLATALGLVTAGLAFALQRVVTATAGYFVILRGDTFNLGDRIVMGGVRGDVIALSFMQTTILEMGEPGGSASTGHGSWVHSRQYTGRIVTVSNAKVFDEPVYNFTREFPYIWEEMTVPVRYGADQTAAERILLAAANRHTESIRQDGAGVGAELQRHYGLPTASVEPRVYLRLTKDWVELTLRFLARTHGVRELKDAISREVLAEFGKAGIGVAASTLELVGPARGAGEGGAAAHR